MADTLTVELAGGRSAEELVRHLDERELDSAKRVACDEVVVRLTEEADESRLAVLVALESWLVRQRRGLVVLRVGSRRHRLRPHPEASVA